MKKFKENVLDVLAYAVRAFMILLMIAMLIFAITVSVSVIADEGVLKVLTAVAIIIGIMGLIGGGMIAIGALIEFSDNRIERIAYDKRKKKLDK